MHACLLPIGGGQYLMQVSNECILLELCPINTVMIKCSNVSALWYLIASQVSLDALEEHY